MPIWHFNRPGYCHFTNTLPVFFCFPLFCAHLSWNVAINLGKDQFLLLENFFGHPGFVKNELVMNNYLGKRASDIIIDQATNIIRNILHVR